MMLVHSARRWLRQIIVDKEPEEEASMKEERDILYYSREIIWSEGLRHSIWSVPTLKNY